MTENVDLDRIRGAALDRIEKAERQRKYLLGGMALAEGLCLVLYVVLADWDDRLHQLIFIAACLVYTTLALGLFSLAAHVQACTQRVLRSVELLNGKRGPDEG
jgi:hypothetical protein